MERKRFRMLLFILIGGAGLMAILAFIPRALYCSPKGKIRIAMAGRSTMDHWFKSWNWPYPIHRYAIWRNWPIPYRKYAQGRYYFELLPVPGPSFSDNADENGGGMFETISRQADPKRYDALFFKYCFVDFGGKQMNEEGRKAQLRQMENLVEKVHRLTKERGMKLLLGTALPVIDPGEESSKLRREFTDWVTSYGLQNKDVVVVDLYKPLMDAEGKLQLQYARAPNDDHVNWKGFRRLDKELFKGLDALFKTSASH